MAPVKFHRFLVRGTWIEVHLNNEVAATISEHRIIVQYSCELRNMRNHASEHATHVPFKEGDVRVVLPRFSTQCVQLVSELLDDLDRCFSGRSCSSIWIRS